MVSQGYPEFPSICVLVQPTLLTRKDLTKLWNLTFWGLRRFMGLMMERDTLEYQYVQWPTTIVVFLAEHTHYTQRCHV